MSYHKIDTVGLAAVMRTAGLIQCENLKLATVLKALKIEAQATHRAMADCEAAREIFMVAVRLMRRTLAETKVGQAP